jgi:hypothetical protein
MNNAIRIFAATAALALAGSALPAHAAPAAQNGEHRDADRQNNANYSNSQRDDSNRQRDDSNSQRDYSNSQRDYSNNSYYQLGNREGYQDYGRKQQRKQHRHKYRDDDDRAAHDSGYQQGWSGQQYNRNSARNQQQYNTNNNRSQQQYNRNQPQYNNNDNRGQQSNTNNKDRHVNDTREPH